MTLHTRLCRMKRTIAATLFFGFGLSPLVCSISAAAPSDFFETEIRPVLLGTCFKCHGQKKTEGNFRVDALGYLTRGGDRGPALVPGKPDQSLLIQAIRRTHKDVQMPPKEPLTEAQIKAFEKWVSQGALWPDSPAVTEGDTGLPGEDHWAYQPIVNHKVPAPKAFASRVRNDIDRFVFTQLEKQKLKPAAEADARTLIRRATFDLTGLPPTPEAIEAFVVDKRPDAYEKLIDQLLASPAYGERWGRHWLDVVRYADTSGDGTDMPILEAYRYRDYVIDVFNEDLPYDQFLIEQIAGDHLALTEPDKRFKQRMIATGYIALARRFGNSRLADFHLIVDNTIDTLGKGVLGMSLGCARCHDHKFDPITREDYYGLYGYFKSTRYPHTGTEHQHGRDGLIPLTTDHQMYEKASAYVAQKAKLVNDTKKADKKKQEEIKAELKELENQHFDLESAWAVVDGENPGDARMMIAGEPNRLGDVSPRGFIAYLNPEKPEIAKDQSGRIALARWVAAKDNPLTARVMANRIWMLHFGAGIVPTPNVFGTQGQPPSHPELLDYLATQFIVSGWSIKSMHRLIMTSSAYRLSSEAVPEGLARDPNNRQIWRFNRQRLDADAIRDAMLAISGTLDTQRPGAHPFPTEKDMMGYSQSRPFAADYDHNHRSVYLMMRRLGKNPFMSLFDGPDTNVSTAERTTSTVPLQALFMMNSDFVRDKARALATKLEHEIPTDADRVRRAYALTYGRAPTSNEQQDALSYLNQYADALDAGVKSEDRPHAAMISLCRVLMASNEFLYID